MIIFTSDKLLGSKSQLNAQVQHCLSLPAKTVAAALALGSVVLGLAILPIYVLEH